MRYLISIWLVLFGGFLLAQDDDIEYEKYTYKSDHWVPHYDFFSKEPYGGYILQEMLARDFEYDYSYAPLAEFLKSRWLQNNEVLVSYSYDLHYRYRDFKQLKNFVSRGNDAVIICEELPNIIEDEFFEEDWLTESGSNLRVDYLSSEYPTTSIRYLSNFKHYYYNWKTIEPGSVGWDYDSEILVQSAEDRVTLVKISYGKGHIYFCSVPMLLSNYYLKQTVGQNFYKFLFNRFEDRTILFDHSSGYPHVIYMDPSYIRISRNLDSDGDGISDYEEGNKDTDGDGIPDSEESNFKDRDNDGLPDNQDTDSDNDGISDSEEGDKDTDGDGVKDRNESNVEDDDEDGKMNHEDADSDGDGKKDGEEEENQSDSEQDPFDEPEEKDELDQRSPLEHVLSDRSLLWAYVLLILLLILYVIYRGKRKQQIVPLIEKDENSSKEFVETVSSLYLSKRQHRNLVVQKQKNFMHFIRNKYYITKKETDKGFFEILEAKSGVDPQIIQSIFDGFKKAKDKKSVSKSDLSDLHNKIETFYKNCK